MERNLLKKIGSLTLSLSLITLILFVLIPPVTAVKLNPGTPNNASASKGVNITFDNVNLTIRSNERIPVEFLNFSVFNESDQLVAHVCFCINSTIISQSPSDTFTVTNITNINALPYGTGSSFGYDENDGTNHNFSYGYGYADSGYTDVNILYTITYETHIKGTFYAKLFVNSSTHTYASSKSSTFTINNGWWNASWLYRKKITIDHTNITENLTNFPVLISRTDTDFKKAQSDGDDFVFVSSDNTTKYNHEIEQWNSSTGELIAWVNVSSLSTTTDTVLWIYYGNPTCSNQQNVEGTWDSDYVMVQHMNGASWSALDDSTSNNNDVTYQESQHGTPTYQQPGKVGYCVRFPGGMQGPYLSFDSSVRNTFPMTVEVWANSVNKLSGNYILSNGAENGNPGFVVDFDAEIGKYYFQMSSISTGKTTSINQGSSNNGVWYYMALKWSGQDTTNGVFNVNKTMYYSAPVNLTGNPGDRILFIGTNSGIHMYSFNGSVDEIRISKIVRSNAWINTSYNNQVSPSTFMSFGTEMDNPAPTVIITAEQTSPTKDSPIDMTATFSKNVTGFVLGDITVTNGTVSNFTAVNGTVYTFNVTPVGQGVVTVNIAAGVAQDAALNDNTAATQFNITFDSVGPVISSISSGTPFATSATITWTTNEDATGNVSYGTTDSYGSWSNYSTFVTSHVVPLTGLSPGTLYHYQVISYDRAGNAAYSTDCNFTTNVAPSSSVTAITPYWKTSQPQIIGGTAFNGPNGLKNVTLWYRFRAANVSSWGGWVSSGLVDIDPWVSVSWDFTFSNGTGHYQFYSIARDNATNTETKDQVAEASCGYDNVSPSSSVSAITPYWKKTSPLTLTVTASDGTGLSGLKNVTLYYYNSTNNHTWGGPWKFGNTNITPWITPTWNFNFPNGTGYYTFYSRAADNATNIQAAPAANNTKCGYDSNSPTAAIGVPINGNYYKILNAISGTCSDASGSGVNTVNITIYNVTANKYWNGTAWSTSVHWFTTTLSGSSWSTWSYDSSAVTWQNASTYIVNVTAEDNASNVGTVAHSTFYYDTYGPVISSVSSGTPSTTSATITWTTNEDATGNVSYGTTDSYGSWSNYSMFVTSHVVPLTGLSPSTTYHYKVISHDRAGNVANSTDRTFFTASSGGGGGGTPPSNPTPVAEAGGPYLGHINKTITFNGSRSTETGGAIAGYRWDWTNDGTYDTGWSASATATHAYTSVGSYTVKLQVKDNSNVTATDTATVTITIRPGTKASQDILDAILADYGVHLIIPFYANDTNGDGVVDTFTDPNHILTAVHFVNINGHASFLLSTENDNIPEFYWDTTTNSITAVHYSAGAIIDTVDNTDAKTITLTVSVEKANWTYIEVTDPYPDSPDLIVKIADGRTISSELIWREAGKIFILDDPVTEYQFIYSYAKKSLFDVTLELTPKSVHVGEDISALITLINVGEPGLVNGSVNYTLYKGEQIVWSSEENVSVLGQKTYTKAISTNGLNPGSYTYTVIYSYSSGQTASAQGIFTVEAVQQPLWENILLWVIIIIILIIIVIIAVLFKLGYLYFDNQEK